MIEARETIEAEASSVPHMDQLALVINFQAFDPSRRLIEDFDELPFQTRILPIDITLCHELRLVMRNVIQLVNSCTLDTTNEQAALTVHKVRVGDKTTLDVELTDQQGVLVENVELPVV